MRLRQCMGIFKIGLPFIAVICTSSWWLRAMANLLTMFFASIFRLWNIPFEESVYIQKNTTFSLKWTQDVPMNSDVDLSTFSGEWVILFFNFAFLSFLFQGVWGVSSFLFRRWSSVAVVRIYPMDGTDISSWRQRSQSDVVVAKVHRRI